MTETSRSAWLFRPLDGRRAARKRRVVSATWKPSKPIVGNKSQRLQIKATEVFRQSNFSFHIHDTHAHVVNQFTHLIDSKIRQVSSSTPSIKGKLLKRQQDERRRWQMLSSKLYLHLWTYCSPCVFHLILNKIIKSNYWERNGCFVFSLPSFSCLADGFGRRARAFQFPFHAINWFDFVFKWIVADLHRLLTSWPTFGI